MVGIALSILLKGLGFGKLLLDGLWKAIQGLFKFAVEKPFQFLTLTLSLGLALLGWYAVATNKELEEVRLVVVTKDKVIREQGETLTKYVKALDVEKKSHVKTIETNNKAVASIKKMADSALAKAKKEAAKVEAVRQDYLTIAARYKNANPSTGSADDRIKREEATNNEFFKEWSKVE